MTSETPPPILDALAPVGDRQPVERAPERMGPLAKLPVFHAIRGRVVLLAGGTDAAAWKAELLAAAGAHVRVFAPTLDDEMQGLIARGAADGAFTHIARPWGVEDFADRAIALAVGDCESTGEAQAFYCAARAAGLPVNVIDKPAFCTFQFGAIVNRSPVVVGISTDGAAPILGQAIRRRVETLLPPWLSDWGRLAQGLRGRVAAHMPDATARRAFWERLSDLAFRGPADPQAEARLEAALDMGDSAQDMPEKGHVALVGAGPGDAEFLTLKAVRALQSADIVLFDDLVADEVLELARREAKRMMVGKRGGRKSCKQDDINALMLRLAQQGKRVVRLKSGDPMVFGRAGEEIAFLEAAGIPVDVVPGISAANAFAATLGTTLTHRDYSHSVRFVTGHSRKGGLPEDIDWAGIAREKATSVFYMGARTSGKIATRLMEEGMSPDTPVAVMASISRADETRWLGRLDTLADGVAALGLDRPILIGVGAVFADARREPKKGVPQETLKTTAAPRVSAL